MNRTIVTGKSTGATPYYAVTWRGDKTWRQVERIGEFYRPLGPNEEVPECDWEREERLIQILTTCRGGKP